ncbi:hypothetical protein V6Z11_D08G197500 [Gossypium hirsutum]
MTWYRTFQPSQHSRIWSLWRRSLFPFCFWQLFPSLL